MTTVERLNELLSGSFTGTIFIPSNTEIRVDGYKELQVRSCVTIKGTRNGLDPGALLSWNIKPTRPEDYGALFNVVGDFVNIEGLRIWGPMTTDDRAKRPDVVEAIRVSDNANHVKIDNNNFRFWIRAVEARRSQPPMTREEANLILVTRNFFNRNAIDGQGYGVAAMRGYVLIQDNLFNMNRHAVAASGDTGGYIARYNYVLNGGFTKDGFWNQHFDAHGSEHNGYGGRAGEHFEITHNTIRGEQTYGPWPYEYTRPAFMLRGQPTDGAWFQDNVVEHDGPEEAVRLKNPGEKCADRFDAFGRPVHYSNKLCNLHVGPNTYNTDTTGQLAVGDFDADDRDDVFLANGTAWWYSSAGLTEWRFLRPSDLLLKDLRFGRFNADARTDVLWSDGANWWVSSGGTDPPSLVRSDGTPLAECVFGNFNRDGLTDALRTNGTTWSISSGARSPWRERRSSSLTAANVRAGDFTGDGIDDVFWIESNTWNLWNPVTNVVTRDHRKPVSGIDIQSLVVADFDGDGLADLGQTEGDGWRWLRGGTLTWAPLRGSGGQDEYREIRWVHLGRFTGERRLAAIRRATSRFPEASRDGFVIWTGAEDAFVPWSPGRLEMH